MMNIFAGPGDTIKCVKLDAGWPLDKTRASQHLVEGVSYTISRIEVSSCMTRVWLEEFPDKGDFNSVHFENGATDMIMVAARQERFGSHPWQTEDINSTIYAVRAITRDLLFDDPASKEEGEDYDICVMLLSAAIIGPDLDELVKFTEIPEERLVDHYEAAQAFGIFTEDGKVECEWFEATDGYVALLCDTLHVRGLLERKPDDDTE